MTDNPLFSRSEIAGYVPAGQRTGMPCPLCGTAGYEPMYANFGLCQRYLGQCPNGRMRPYDPLVKSLEQARRRLPPSATGHNDQCYKVGNVQVEEIDVPPGWDVSVMWPINGNVKIMTLSRQLNGYSIEEWSKDGIMFGRVKPPNSNDVFGKQISMDDLKPVTLIQILHIDMTVRVQHG